MLILVGHATTPDKLKLITSAAGDIDTHVTYIDCSDASPPVPDAPNKENHTITTAATTDICAGVTSAAKRRNVKTIHIRNTHPTVANDVTVVYDAIDGNDYELHKATLDPGEQLEYIEGVGFFEVGASAPDVFNSSAADQGPGFAVDTYLTGSNLLVGGRLKVGSILRWKIVATKTAAGIAAPIWIIRFGTAGAIGDTARCTMTSPAQTAVIDTAVWEIFASVRSIGAAGVVASSVGCMHALATTGFSISTGGARVTSAGFDTGVAGLQAGISVNGGTSAAWTVHQVQAEACNLV
jgi:hypothetical protein